MDSQQSIDPNIYCPQLLASALLKQWSEKALFGYYESFNWNGESHADSIRDRENLLQLGKSIPETADAVVLFFNDIRKWGFNNSPLPDSLIKNANFKKISLELFLACKHGDDSDKSDAIAAMLAVKGLGIANVSKFVAMCDPVRGAIYDSRVSIALRCVSLESNNLFPVVGRRKTKRNIHVPASSLTTLKKNRFRLTAIYLAYLSMLDQVRQRTKFKTNSQIEMALFMIGA